MVSLQQKQLGFTLLELMISIAIVAILAMIAVPSFNNLIDRSDLKTVAVTIHADMENARLAAVAAGAGGSARVNFFDKDDLECSYEWCYRRITGDKILTRSSGDFPSGIDLALTGFGDDAQIDVSQQYFLDGDSGTIALTSRSGEHSASVVRNAAGIFVLCSSQSIMGYATCP